LPSIGDLGLYTLWIREDFSICVGQLPIPVTNARDKQLIRRKGLVWLTVSEGSTHKHYCFGSVAAQYILIGACGRGPHGSQEARRKREREQRERERETSASHIPSRAYPP
jgi:hypothetical protein